MARARTWYIWGPTGVALAAGALLQIGLGLDSPRDHASTVLSHDPQPVRQSGTAIPARTVTGPAPTTEIMGATGHVLVRRGENTDPVRYRWVAPAGVERIRFEVTEPSLAVAAYALDSRLVSGVPAASIAFPVRSGAEYWIEARRTDAALAGEALRWQPDNSLRRVRNDDVADADAIAGFETNSHFGFIDPNAATVEPREPMASGVRTAWWAWTAPSTARYAWQVTAMIPHPLALAVFSDREEVRLIDRSAANRLDGRQLVFDAIAGTRYLIAVGLHATDAVAAIPAGPIVFAWGPTPANDDRGFAEPLTGASGSVPGSTEFATMQPGEQAAPGGQASVWWRWRAPRTQWYRFALDDTDAGTITVYPARPGDAAGPPLAVSRATPTPVAVFEATAGETYAVRVAHHPLSVERRFRLSWDPDARPAWLRFRGIAGGLDASGVGMIAAGGPDRIAFNSNGKEMYVATEAGLAVYDRGPSGRLSHRRTIAGVDRDTRLFFDAQTGSLIAVSCNALRKFAAGASGQALTAPQTIAGRIPCTSRQLAAATLLRDATGSFVHFAGPLGIATLRFNRDRSVLAFMRGTPVEGVVAATLGVDDAFLYAATEDGLHVFARDRNTGVLTARGQVQPNATDGAAPIRLLKSARSGGHLFALTQDRRVRAYGLTVPEMPVLIAETLPIHGAAGTRRGSEAPLPGTRQRQTPCSFMGVRADGITADVLCADMAFSTRLLLNRRTVRWEDILHPGGIDAFGSSLPHFRLGQGIAVSPDDRHIYATQPGQLLLFERPGQS
ncbi:MAG: hypothetical protein OXG82_07470 [Gammaproteobacteria bacterium]|nr:hypothetical protein [Gammaproteobacteria bacterium]